MAVPAKLAGFAFILLVAFGAAFGVGRAVGPVGEDPPTPSPTSTTTSAPHEGGHP